MAIGEIERIYDSCLCQIAAESYFEDTDSLNNNGYLSRQLNLGTNRPGYVLKDSEGHIVDDLNQGWPGLTRMTDAQASEFLSKFKVIHQWSDNPCTGNPPGSRPAEDLTHCNGLILNSQDMLANTGFSATLIQNRQTGEFTLSLRSTESRSWEDGGDKERDMTATDALGVVGVGFALAQLDAMEKYYQWLKDNELLPVGATLNVTGYSLGGHLATVFTEIHQNDADIKFGQTVTFNGAGRGNWDQSAGSEGEFIAYFHSVLDDPSRAGLILADCAPDKVERAELWWLANKAAFVGAGITSTYEGVTGGFLGSIRDAATAAVDQPFDPKSIYQDVRYAWATIATILTYDLAPDLPLGEEVTLADDRITQVFGYEGLSNVNMTANSQVNAPECKVAVEAQPLIDGGGGFLGLPGDYGFAHSIDLIVDSLALQRAISQLDSQFTLEEFVSIKPMLSRRSTQNVIGTNYEADALENALDALRRVIQGPAVVATTFHEGAGGYGDWESRNGFHNNLQALTDSEAFKAVAGKVRFGVADPLQAMIARRDFGSFLGLLTLSPVYLRATPGNEGAVEQVLAAAWPDIHDAWVSDAVAGKDSAFSDSWIADRSLLLSGLGQINAFNSTDNKILDLSRPDSVYLSDRESDREVTLVGRRLAEASLQILFDASWTMLPLSGGEGNDRLYGGIGGSELHGGGGDDRLEGLIREDFLFGEAGRDTLIGGDGDDHLCGGKDADRLEGGTGRDEYLIQSGDGLDTVYDSDGAGVIMIDGRALSSGKLVTENAWLSLDGRFRYALTTGRDGSPALQIFPVGGIRSGDVTQLLVEHFHSGDLGLSLEGQVAGGDSDGVIRGDVAPAWLTGFDDQNQPYQILQFDRLGNIVGTPGAQARPDMLMGSGDGDEIQGGEGNDTLLGRAGNDRVLGDNGADFMAGGLGDDVLDGGFGNDLMYGDSDPWDFEVAAGFTPVPDSVAAPVPGAIFVDSGIHWARFQANAGDLAVSNANPDAITPVLYQLSPTRFGQVPILAYPRRAFGQSAGGVDTLLGGEGDDLLFGEAGCDLLRGNEGADALHGGSGDDALDGGDGDDVLFGDDLTFAQFRWSQLDIGGYYRGTPEAEIYEAEFGGDYLEGGLGDDYLFGMAGADLLFGDAGNDYLVGDFFEVVSIPVLRLGEDGATWIIDESPHFAEAVQFHGNDYLDGGDGDDYLVGLAGDDQLFGGAGRDVLVADGNPDEVQGRYGNDFLDGGDDADFLQGSGGNDHLLGGAGDDELWGDEYAGTDGQLLSGWGSAPVGGTATGMLPQALHGADVLEGGDGKDTLTGGGGDDRLEGGAGNDLLFGDGVGVVLEGNDRLYGGDGDDELQGNAGDDVLMGEAGNDRLFGQLGNDVLSGGEGDDRMDGGAGNDRLQAGDGADVLFGQEGDDLLLGDEGDDQLVGGDGDDELTGGLGVDYLGGGTGDDLYHLSAGEAPLSGTVMEFIDDPSGQNRLDLGTVPASSLSVHSVEGSKDLILYFAADDGVYIRGGATGALSSFCFDGQEQAWDGLLANYLVDPVEQQEPTDNAYVVGSRMADSLVLGQGALARAGLGDDYIRLMGGGNEILFNAGDGRDSVVAGYIQAASFDINKLHFGSGILPSDIHFILAGSFVPGQLSQFDIQVGSSPGDAISLQVARDNLLASSAIGAFEFADGSRWSLQDLVDSQGLVVSGSNADEVLVGSNLADRLLGLGGNDWLDGGAGTDWLDGGAGNDDLLGGDGADTYVFRPNEGDDSILEAGSGAAQPDVLLLGEGITANNLMVGRDSQHLYLRVSGSFGGLRINNQIDRPECRVELFQFADGTAWTADEVLSRAVDGPLPSYWQGTDANDTVSGSSGDDVLSGEGGIDCLDGADGNDLVVGGDGNDTLQGGAGDDVLEGDGGFDILSGGVGQDTLSGGEGPDQLAGGDGSDLLQGDDGDDRLLGDAGDDILTGGAGADHLSGGDGNDSLDGQDGNDWLQGDAGNDLLQGADGQDALEGGDGDDVLWGGAGGDSLNGGAGSDDLSGEGDDDTLFGEDGNDHLQGGAGADSLYGGTGDDVLHGDDGADLLTGEAGNDLLYGDDGEDRLLAGAGRNELHGGAGNDDLTGGLGTDSLFGEAGNDVLRLASSNSLPGPAVLAGGSGDDLYILAVPAAAISVTIMESAGEGIDTVQAWSDYALPANVENLTLVGFTDLLDFNGTGNALDNILRGNVGINVLAGGAGNDTYYAGYQDSVVEHAGEGEDTIYADLDWTLGADVENLVLTGRGQWGTGNALANRIVGDDMDNVLDGGAGADYLEGQYGNDMYVVDSESDVVVEVQGNGFDTVFTSVSLTSLADNVEYVTLTGKRSINAAGNALNNVLTGNSGVNILKGGAGDDVYVVGAKDSTVELAGEGIDTVRSAVAWVLAANVENLELTGSAKVSGTGNDLDNRLSGNAAANVLKGGKGNDTYVVGQGDSVIENAGEGIDTIESAMSWTLGANLENLTLTGYSMTDGTGNGLSNRMRGSPSLNTLRGGAGNDYYLVGRGSASDTIVETDTTAGNVDRVVFDPGISREQLWFRHDANSLEVSIIGTEDRVMISDWYSSSGGQVEYFQLANGEVLSSASVEVLVQAMAAMPKPPLDQTELSTQQLQQLDPVLAACWQAA